MSRVPYLDRLGDEFERAVTEWAPRRQPRGGTVLAIAFVMVLLAGQCGCCGTRDPDIASFGHDHSAPRSRMDRAPTIPDTWARVSGDLLANLGKSPCPGSPRPARGSQLQGPPTLTTQARPPV